MNNYDLIFSLGKKVLEGNQLTFDEALALTTIEEGDIPLLLGVANKVREKFTGSYVDTCQILNARSGNCTEDCKFKSSELTLRLLPRRRIFILI